MECQKSHFTLNGEEHYINCAYMSPLLKTVEEKGIEGVLLKRNPSTISSNLFFETTKLLRKEIAHLIHAKLSNSISIIPSVSYGMSNIANNIQCSKGQNIIVVAEEFPSNYLIWDRLCREKGLELRVIYPDSTGNKTETWNRKIIEAIDSNTAVVAISHVHWIYGIRFDLENISAAVHENNGYLIIDGSQSVGILDLDVEKVKIDALVCTGYKWLLGPYSIGFAYFNERFHNGIPIEENWMTRSENEDFSRLTDYERGYGSGAVRYDVGETSNFILTPMFLESVRQINAWKPKHLYDYCTDLTMELFNDFERWGFIDDTSQLCPHLFGIQINKLNPLTLQTALNANNIRTSVRGGFLRISPNIYNTLEDIDLLRSVLSDIPSDFK